MSSIVARPAELRDLDAIQRLLCGTPGRPGGPLRGTQPSAAGVSDMLQRVILPVVTVDAVGDVRSIVSAYGLDLVGEDFVFLSICSDERVVGSPLAILGVAAWLDAFRSRFPLTRVLLEGPSAVFRDAGFSRALLGPLVRRSDSWWISGRFEEYQMWELDVGAALELAERFRTSGGTGHRRPELDLQEFTAEFRVEMGLTSGPEEDLALDSLATVEALALIAEMAGAELVEDAVCERIDSIATAFAFYQRLCAARRL